MNKYKNELAFSASRSEESHSAAKKLDGYCLNLICNKVSKKGIDGKWAKFVIYKELKQKCRIGYIKTLIFSPFEGFGVYKVVAKLSKTISQSFLLNLASSEEEAKKQQIAYYQKKNLPNCL